MPDQNKVAWPAWYWNGAQGRVIDSPEALEAAGPGWLTVDERMAKEPDFDPKTAGAVVAAEAAPKPASLAPAAPVAFPDLDPAKTIPAAAVDRFTEMSRPDLRAFLTQREGKPIPITLTTVAMRAMARA